MKKIIPLLFAAGSLLLAGCSTPVRTLESKDGKMTMTEQRSGGRPPLVWDFQEVPSKAEATALRQSGWKLESVIHSDNGPDMFLMKRKSNAQPGAIWPPPAFRPLLVTTFGTNNTPDGTWQISVSETSADLSRKTVVHEGMSARSTISPGDWKPRPGWFVFAENESRVWAYDGDRMLFLDVETVNGSDVRGVNYCNSGFPCPVPPEVLARLSEPARKALDAKQR